MRKSIPKNFTKYASSPTKEGILKAIESFYCGPKKTMVRTHDGYYQLYSGEKGQVLPLIVIETSRGFYFGKFESHE